MRTLALLLVLSACGASVALRDEQTEVLYAAYTRCAMRTDGTVYAYTFTRHDLSPLAALSVAAHERVHRESIQRFGTCAEYREWLFRGDNRLRDEARAYCAAARVVAYERNVSIDSVIVAAAQTLTDRRVYPYFTITPEEARDLIAAVCREARP